MPDAPVVVAVLVALIGALGGYATARKTTKPAEVTAEAGVATSLLASYDAFADRLQAEVSRVSTTCSERIAALERSHAAEQAEWSEERAELRQRIEELEAKVVALLSLPARPPSARTRRQDKA